MNQTMQEDLVPEGAVIAYNPPINIKDGRDYKYFTLPEGWVPCLGGELLESTTANPSSESAVVYKYAVPDMRCRSIIGYDWDLNQLYNPAGDFYTKAHMQQGEVATWHRTQASDGSTLPSLLSATNYLTREDPWSQQHNAHNYSLGGTEVDAKLGDYSREDAEFRLGERDYLLAYHSGKEQELYATFNKFAHMHPFVRLVYIQKAIKPKASPNNYIWYHLTVGKKDVYIPIYWPDSKPSVLEVYDAQIYYGTGGGSGSGTNSIIDSYTSSQTQDDSNNSGSNSNSSANKPNDKPDEKPDSGSSSSIGTDSGNSGSSENSSGSSSSSASEDSGNGDSGRV